MYGPSVSEPDSVSVVIATYNHGRYVAATVADVLAQENFGGELEVVVVDDGSTDGTEDALAPLRDRIVYRRIAHAGRPAVPRNVALELATGAFVAFQDADDFWARDKLRVQLASFRADPGLAISYGNSELLTAEGEPTGELVLAPGVARSGNVFPELLARNFVSGHTPLARRALVLEVGGFDESPALKGVEDYELWLKLAARGPLEYEDRVLAYYRRHPTSVSMVPHAVQTQRYVAVYRATLRWIDRERRPLVHRRLAEAGGGATRAYHRLRARRPTVRWPLLRGSRG